MAAPMASAPVQQSGSMLSGLGSTIAQGFAFGTGSAVAHQAVGAAVGAMSGGGSSSGQAAPMEQEQAFDANSLHGSACGNDKQLFFDCLKANNGDDQSCSFLFEQLQACQQHSPLQAF